MRVLGIVPARGGSTRVPMKNLRLLGGRPLVSWALSAAVESRLLSRVVVSSDDPRILRVAEDCLPGSALLRPAVFARADSPAIEYVTHAVAHVLKTHQESVDAVAIIQPTSPFTRGVDIDGVIELLGRSQSDSAVTVVRVPHDVHPAKMKRLQGSLLVPYIEEEAERFSHLELPAIYVRNGSVYAATLQTVQSGTLVGPRCAGYEMPRERSVDINDPTDLAWAEYLYDRLQGDSLSARTD